MISSCFAAQTNGRRLHGQRQGVEQILQLLGPAPNVAVRPPTAMARWRRRRRCPGRGCRAGWHRACDSRGLAMLSIQRTRCSWTAPTKLRAFQPGPADDQSIDADRQEEVGERREVERRGKAVEAHVRIPPLALPASAAIEQLQAVERALQDQRGGDLVDHLGAAACARHRPRAASARPPPSTAARPTAGWAAA